MKTWVLLIAKYATALCFLHYVGELGWKASLSIVIFLPLYLPWNSSNMIDISNFTPFVIDFSPHVGIMLFDLGLISEDKWKESMQQTDIPSTFSGSSLAQNGARCVVLSMRPDGDHTCHWPLWNYYTSSYEFEVKLDFINFSGRYSPWSPGFFFRHSIDGYHLGIEVREDWWKENRERLEKTGKIKKVENEHRFGTVRISLAIFPSSTFWPFYRAYDKSMREKINSDALAKGWKPDTMGHAEIGYFGDSFTSEYADIYLRFLPSLR